MVDGLITLGYGGLGGCSLHSPASSVLATGVYVLQLDFAWELFDDYGWHSASLNPGRITPIGATRLVLIASMTLVKNQVGSFGLWIENSAGTILAQTSGYCANVGENRACCCTAFAKSGIGEFFTVTAYSFSPAGDLMIPTRHASRRFWSGSDG